MPGELCWSRSQRSCSGSSASSSSPGGGWRTWCVGSDAGTGELDAQRGARLRSCGRGPLTVPRLRIPGGRGGPGTGGRGTCGSAAQRALAAQGRAEVEEEAEEAAEEEKQAEEEEEAEEEWGPAEEVEEEEQEEDDADEEEESSAASAAEEGATPEVARLEEREARRLLELGLELQRRRDLEAWEAWVLRLCRQPVQEEALAEEETQRLLLEDVRSRGVREGRRTSEDGPHQPSKFFPSDFEKFAPPSKKNNSQIVVSYRAPLRTAF